MADKIEKKPVEEVKPEKEYVEFRVPRGNSKEDSIFVGVNFKNYILKRGEWVRVPKEVYEVLKNSEMAEEIAEAYARGKETAYLEKAAKL